MLSVIRTPVAVGTTSCRCAISVEESDTGVRTPVVLIRHGDALQDFLHSFFQVRRSRGRVECDEGLGSREIIRRRIRRAEFRGTRRLPETERRSSLSGQERWVARSFGLSSTPLEAQQRLERREFDIWVRADILHDLYAPSAFEGGPRRRVRFPQGDRVESELRPRLPHVGNGSLSSWTRGPVAGRSNTRANLIPSTSVTKRCRHRSRFAARDYPQAIHLARQAIALDPAFWVGCVQLGQAYEQTGSTDLALDALTEGGRLTSGNSKTLSLRGYILARQRRTKEAEGVLYALEAVAPDRHVPPYATALIYAGLGDDRAALEKPGEGTRSARCPSGVSYL